MNQLYDINAGMKGGEVSTRVNGNMSTIKAEIERLESLIKTIQGQIPGGGEVEEEVFQGVSIVALPESTVLGTSTSSQTVEIPINVYYGRKKLVYNSYDDGVNSFAVDLGSTNIYNDSHVLLAKVGAKISNSQLVLVVTISPNIETTFSYEFEVSFMNVRYKKVIAFNIIASEGQSALDIELSPSTVIINEAYSGSTLEMDNAKCTYAVYFGSTDVTNNVSCQITAGSCLNCNGEVNQTNHTITITEVTSVGHEGEGCKLFQWTDLNGTQHSAYKVTNGYIQLLFSYTSPEGTNYRCIKKFNFAVNYLGTFKESIVNDVHTQVSEKVITTLDENGLLLTESAKTEIYQDAERIALSAVNSGMSGINQSYLEITDRLFQVVNTDISGNTAQILSNTENIRLALSGVSGNTTAINLTQGEIELVVSGLTKTGIDIQEGQINVSAGTFNIIDDKTGKQIAVFSGNGLSTEVIEASNIQAKEIHVSSASTGCSVDIWPDGSMKAKKAIFEDCTVTGSLNTPFIEMDDFIDGYHSSNFNTSSSNIIHWDSAGNTHQYPDDCLTWDISQSGRKIIFDMYAYDGTTIAEGTVTLNAPTSENPQDQMYFFEDGIKKTKINISREMLELIGLSSGNRFLGYVVLKRIDIGTISRYGHTTKCLCMGTVSYTPTSGPYISYHSFDGSTVEVSPITGKVGCTHLSWPEDWFHLSSADKYVMLNITPIGTVDGDSVTPLNGCVYGRTYTSANVVTYDVSTNKPTNGSYSFMLYHLNDWVTLNGTVSGGW